MSFRVSITPTGQRSVRALRGKARKSFDAAVERLASEGCKAGDYRLSGEGIERICSVQLYGRHRVLVCFPDDESIVVLAPVYYGLSITPGSQAHKARATKARMIRARCSSPGGRFLSAVQAMMAANGKETTPSGQVCAGGEPASSR